LIYQWVAMPKGCPSLDPIYGESTAGSALMPVGEKGEEILRRAKQSEAERRECQKRGAE